MEGSSKSYPYKIAIPYHMGKGLTSVGLGGFLISKPYKLNSSHGGDLNLLNNQGLRTIKLTFYCIDILNSNVPHYNRISLCPLLYLLPNLESDNEFYIFSIYLTYKPIIKHLQMHLISPARLIGALLIATLFGISCNRGPDFDISQIKVSWINILSK